MSMKGSVLKERNYMRVEFLTTLKMSMIFWVVMLWGLLGM
jgi:hypothetical protein